MYLRIAAAAAALLAVGCATVPPPPTPDVLSTAHDLQSYTAELGVKLRGPGIRGPRVTTLVGFQRPDRLRLEIPGPGGARLIVVARGGQLVAVFPQQRAVLEAAATERVLGDVTGVALEPHDVMDFLVGKPPARVSGYRAQWGPAVPRKIEGELADGTRLDVHVREPEPAARLQERAFDPPPHAGYRSIDVAEARNMWTR